ncbi:signal peptidase II [Candidatus Pantoea carbekii]|uniref:signal peptidase II n=1 Tax=Candidatus Pantoea carbekii TaxID=1235990 RepID=UPI0006187AD5|nr:signal peptidase II [Candidatus Pantoea carbekii]AKC31954.1 lipoprotein signal peptidase [Candidatus Pantoea carbekii]
MKMKIVSFNELAWLWLAFLVTIIDIVTKYWINNNIVQNEIYPFAPFFNLFYVRNYGVIFSLLSDKNGAQRWFLAFLAIIIIVILVVLMYRTDSNYILSKIAYALIIGGALGNLFDRIYYGFIIDFIDFYIGQWHFATFNIADSSICIGTTFLIVENFFSSKRK